MSTSSTSIRALTIIFTKPYYWLTLLLNLHAVVPCMYKVNIPSPNSMGIGFGYKRIRSAFAP